MPKTKIGGYELEESLYVNEKVGFPATGRKGSCILRGGGGKVHVFNPYFDEMQTFTRLSYPSPDNDASAETHVSTISCFHHYGGSRWTDFREDLRYIKKTGIMVINYDNVDDPAWPKDIEFEGYFFCHQTRRAFIQLRYLKNNSAETKTVKLIFYIDLKVGGDQINDQGVWDDTRGAFRCWDAVNPKACYMLIGSPTAPTHRGIDETLAIWTQCYYGTVTDKDSYGPGDAAVGVQFNITLDAGASTVLPFYIVLGDSQSDVESEWDALLADDYSKLLSDTKSSWEGWVDEGIVATFEDNPWMGEAWIRNVISCREMTWSNGGISAASGGAVCANFIWDSYYAARTLLQAGHIDEVRDYLQFLRTCVANDSFTPYPSICYNYAYSRPSTQYDAVHAVFLQPILVWELCQKTKNLTDLSDNWAMVKKYLDYVADNWYSSEHHLVLGPGELDHSFRWHTGWGKGKYYAAFNIGYQKAFAVGSEIARLTNHPTEEARYKQIADELQVAIDSCFLVGGVYKSVWHPTLYPTAEGWDIETCSKYGEVGYCSDNGRKTFLTWRVWLKDYLPPHYDEVDYSGGNDWINTSSFGSLLHTLILYGRYSDFAMLYNRFREVANLPKVQCGESLKQYKNDAGQLIFAWSHAVTGALARLFDWTIDDSGSYLFALSPAPEIGRFKATFPDGTSVTVSGKGDGSRAEVSVEPYKKDYAWDGERRKVNVTLKAGEALTFNVAMGGSLGLSERAAFNRKADLIGEKVEVQRKTVVGYDDFGNPIHDYTTYNVEIAIVQPVRSGEETVGAGLLAVGDDVGYFKARSSIAKNFRVKLGNAVYEVLSVDKIRTQGVTIYLKANLKRVI